MVTHRTSSTFNRLYRPWVWLFPLVVAGSVVSPSLVRDAHAQQNKEEAKSRFKRGMELFKEGDYATSLIEFKKAYEINPHFQTLYNIGRVYWQLNNYAGALDAFQKYLKEGGDTISASRRIEVEEDVAKLKQRVGQLEFETKPPGATVSIDDIPIEGVTPFKVNVSAGRRRVTFSKKGFLPKTIAIDVAGREVRKVETELIESGGSNKNPPTDPTATTTSTSTSAPPPPPPPPEESSSGAWIGFTAAGVFGAAATVTGLLALSANSDLNTKKTQGNQTKSSLDDANSKRQTLSLTTDILLGAAIVSAGIGITLMLTSGGSSEKPVPTTALRFTPTGVNLTHQFF
jgi:hypothetical protein